MILFSHQKKGRESIQWKALLKRRILEKKVSFFSSSLSREINNSKYTQMERKSSAFFIWAYEWALHISNLWYCRVRIILRVLLEKKRKFSLSAKQKISQFERQVWVRDYISPFQGKRSFLSLPQLFQLIAVELSYVSLWVPLCYFA